LIILSATYGSSSTGEQERFWNNNIYSSNNNNDEKGHYFHNAEAEAEAEVDRIAKRKSNRPLEQHLACRENQKKRFYGS